MLKDGMPPKLEGKIALLRKKLDKTLEANPVPQGSSDFSETSKSAQDFANAMSLRPTSVFNFGNPCNQAMMEGVAAITIGSAIGPHAAKGNGVCGCGNMRRSFSH